MRRIWAGLLCAVIALAGTVACGVVSQTEPEYVVYFREADLAESAGGDALRAEPVSVEGGNTVRTAQQLMERCWQALRMRRCKVRSPREHSCSY